MEARIVIIGSGPAGLSTALHLLQQAPGLAAGTLILEKARHPRPKVCGGGLVPDAEAVLAGLGLDPAQLPQALARTALFTANGSRMEMRFDRDLPYAFRVVQRQEFDAWLAAETRRRGVQIEEQTSVLEILPADRQVTLRTDRGEIRAEAVVCAHGSNGLLPTGWKRRPVHKARLLEITRPMDPGSISEAAARFDFTCMRSGVMGYVWDFPQQRNGVSCRSRGIYDANLALRTKPVALKPILSEAAGLDPADREIPEFHSHPVRWFHPAGQLAGSRILLAGDAAGADSLCGEGISLALGYGRLAAAALREGFAANDLSFSTYRREVLTSPLGICLLWRYALAGILYSLPSAVLPEILFSCAGGLVRWILRNLALGWSRRGSFVSPAG